MISSLMRVPLWLVRIEPAEPKPLDCVSLTVHCSSPPFQTAAQRFTQLDIKIHCRYMFFNLRKDTFRERLNLTATGSTWISKALFEATDETADYDKRHSEVVSKCDLEVEPNFGF
jgi:hypothetical protein